ncbi:SGNH/GDSL hydrolase family protein [Microbacterium sp. C7(2022)]|uniref:SGNH/GDSL hydrolase family protein n=1 Tax=Microbacterium sp. C7(2022) TaxID=2992759 RepID=UPI00237BB0D2|nr:SGNH/GDSL hydrolase family protein [Microbacterium sp. C7(2022)]
MRERGRLHAPRPWLVLTAVACALAVVCTMALWRPWLQTSVPAAGGDEPVAAGAELLTIDDDAQVLVFGDSWVYGSAAIVPELGFAYRLGENLGWTVTVDGVRGSGYLKPGIDGPAYGERIAALDPQATPSLVLVEGSINDRKRYAPDVYRDAVNAAWDALAATYPRASIVILGPAPQVLPVEAGTAAIDRDLADLAAQRGWWYISPVREAWISPDNYLEVIDTGAGNDHPSTAGHAYLAERVMAALSAITAPSDVIADAPVSPTPIAP